MRTVTRKMTWVLLALLCLAARPVAGGGPQNVPGLKVDKGSIGGVVVNSAGGKAEAGVWVIAETKSLPAPFRRIVVTDDQGRFLVPDLPEGEYEVWVRGYGLKDSERTKALCGETVKLQVANAATPQEAAKIYPASYWTSLIQPPPMSELPAKYKSQDEWLATLRNGCNHCHELGMPQTRIYTTAKDWDAMFLRAKSMHQELNGLGRDVVEKMLADWGSRIAAGEVPPAPPRPTGIERNVVISQWDWGFPESFVHDLISTDKRNPTLYPNGKVYGVDRTGGGRLLILDPVKNAVSWLQVEPRDKSHGYSLTKDYYHGQEEEQAYVGEDKEWMASPHNPMFDEKGRLWMTVQIRAGGHDYYPAWAKNTIVTDNPADVDAAYNLVSKNGNNMQLGYFDTKTNKFVTVDTGYNTHHLQLDWQDRVWTDGGGSAAGELDTRKLDLTSLDTIKATEAGAQKTFVRVDPETKKMIPGTGYGEAVSPVDGTVWYSSPVAGGPANKLYMVDPKTDKITDYPLPPPGRFPHGIDFSSDGNVWVSLGSGQLGRLNRKTGEWKFWDTPGLKFKGTGKETGSTDFPYYLWVDQFNVSGLGKDTVFETGTTSDAQFVFDPKKETFVVFHVPYPMPYYARGLDGRIDDPNAGWKGRGLWMTYSSYLPRFTENRSGTVNHMQIRPNPLAN
jgi:streptogramin lyase